MFYSSKRALRTATLSIKTTRPMR